MTTTSDLYRFANRMRGRQMDDRFIEAFNQAFALGGTTDEVVEIIYQFIEDDPVSAMGRSYILFDFIRGITELCVCAHDERVILHMHSDGRLLWVDTSEA